MNSLYASDQLKQVIWPDFISHFRSEVSISSYRTDITEFMNYFQRDFTTLNDAMAQEYYVWLEKKVKQGNIQPITMAKKYRELHSFADYIVKNRDNYDIPDNFQDYFFPYLKGVAKIEKLARSIPIEDIDKLFAAAQNDLMAYCILVLIYRVGLSSTEITGLKLSDFAAYDNGVVATIAGRDTDCFVPEDVYAILEKYIAVRDEHEYLFYNKRRNKLNTMYISRLMKTYTQLAEIDNYSAEALRNSCAVTMFAYSAKPEQVAAQMGVTQIQIKRYKDMSYRDNLLRKANSMVKLKVEPPDC